MKKLALGSLIALSICTVSYGKEQKSHEKGSLDKPCNVQKIQSEAKIKYSPEKEPFVVNGEREVKQVFTEAAFASKKNSSEVVLHSVKANKAAKGEKESLKPGSEELSAKAIKGKEEVKSNKHKEESKLKEELKFKEELKLV